MQFIMVVEVRLEIRKYMLVWFDFLLGLYENFICFLESSGVDYCFCL